MVKQPTYEALNLRIKELEEESAKHALLEESLFKSEEKYKLLINNLPCVVYKGFKDFSVEFFD